MFDVRLCPAELDLKKGLGWHTTPQVKELLDELNWGMKIRLQNRLRTHVLFITLMIGILDKFSII